MLGGRDVGDVQSRCSLHLVAAGIDEDALEPGLEPGSVAQARPVSPGGDEGVVYRILGGKQIAEDGPRQTVARVEVFIGQATEDRGSVLDQ